MSQGGPSEDIDSLLLRAVEIQRVEDRLTEAYRRGVRVEIREVFDAAPRGSVLAHDPEHASRLAGRHRSHYRSVDIVRAVLAAARGERDALAKLRALLDQRGCFLKHYSNEVYAERLRDPQSLIVVVEALDPATHLREECGTYDCQLPPDGAREHVARTPRTWRQAGGEYLILDDQLVSTIEENPSAVGLVRDIAVAPGMEMLHVGGEGRHIALQEVEHCNEGRAQPIRYLAAEVFSIQAVRCPDGRVVTLEEIDPEHGPLDNGRSILFHLAEGRHQARRGWILKGDEVEVEIDGETYVLIVDWWVFIQIVRNGGTLLPRESLKEAEVPKSSRLVGRLIKSFAEKLLWCADWLSGPRRRS